MVALLSGLFSFGDLSMSILSPDHIFRDFVTDGVPGSGNHDPEKGDIREFLNAFTAATFKSKAFVETIGVGSSVTALRTNGYAAPGDGGGALYQRVDSEPSHEGKVRSTDRYLSDGTEDSVNGGWWEVVLDDTRVFQSVSEMSSTAGAIDGSHAFLVAYHPPSYPQTEFHGGGVFVFSASTPKSSHNGSTIISPTVPWTWADNGVSYLAGTGETDVGGTGCWIRLGTDQVTPFEFGAIEGIADDSTAAVHASLNFYLSDVDNNFTYDGGGSRFGVSSSYQFTSEIYRKRVKNLHLQAIAAFSGAMIDLRPTTGRLTDVHFKDCFFQGGSPSTAALCDGLMLVDSTLGFWLHSCKFFAATDYLFKNLKDGAGSETHIESCEFNGVSEIAGNENVIAIDLDGFDNLISNCLSEQCGTHFLIRGGGCRILGNHIYNYGSADFDAWAIDCNSFGNNIQINNNQIDDVRVRFYNPIGVQMNSNRFLQSSGDNWTVFRAFVWFFASELNYTPERIVIQGNTFQSNGGAVSRAFNSAVEGDGTFDFSGMINVYIKDNIISSSFGYQTSHPRGTMELIAETTGAYQLDAVSPWGTSQATPFKFVRNAILNNASPSVIASVIRGYVNPSTKIAEVELSDSVTATVLFEATVNSTGE